MRSTGSGMAVKRRLSPFFVFQLMRAESRPCSTMREFFFQDVLPVLRPFRRGRQRAQNSSLPSSTSIAPACLHCNASTTRVRSVSSTPPYTGFSSSSDAFIRVLLPSPSFRLPMKLMPAMPPVFRPAAAAFTGAPILLRQRAASRPVRRRCAR